MLLLYLICHPWSPHVWWISAAWPNDFTETKELYRYMCSSDFSYALNYLLSGQYWTTYNYPFILNLCSGEFQLGFWSCFDLYQHILCSNWGLLRLRSHLFQWSICKKIFFSSSSKRWYIRHFETRRKGFSFQVNKVFYAFLWSTSWTWGILFVSKNILR